MNVIEPHAVKEFRIFTCPPLQRSENEFLLNLNAMRRFIIEDHKQLIECKKYDYLGMYRDHRKINYNIIFVTVTQKFIYGTQ